MDSRELFLLFSGMMILLTSFICSATAHGQVIAYQHANQGGASISFPEGSWPVPAWMNDQISSLVVHPGWRATLFEHSPGGRVRSYTSNTPYVGDEMNDRASFVQVERNKVIAFRDSNYIGPLQEFVPGAGAAVIEAANDQISSLQIPHGMVATLFEHSVPTPSGVRWSYLTGVPYVGDTMNDRASYLKLSEASDFAVNSLRITIRTGGDDLRCNSQAYALVGFRNGSPRRYALNNGANWANGSTHTANITLPSGTVLSDLISFGINFVSGRCADTESGDNWNVDGVEVEFAGTESRGTLLSRSGAPVVRLTEDGLRDWRADTLVAATFDRAFVHIATTDNSSGHMTFLDHPLANNNPQAIINATQNRNPNGRTLVVDNNHAIGVWYNGSRWAIFNQDFAAMPNQAAFNVKVSASSSANEFVHRAGGENIVVNRTIIGYPTSDPHTIVNDQANALLFVTNRWENIYNNQNLAVWYDSYRERYAPLGGRWTIVNQENDAAMPVGAAFNVDVATGPSETDFTHRATVSNISSNYTVLDHPVLNGNPQAQLLVTATHSLGGVDVNSINNHALGVFYTGSRWAIFNQDRVAMSPDAAFNVRILHQ